MRLILKLTLIALVTSCAVRVFLCSGGSAFAIHIGLGMIGDYHDETPPIRRDCSQAHDINQRRQCLTAPCPDNTNEASYLQHQCYNRDIPPRLNTNVSLSLMPYLLKDVDASGQRVKLELIMLMAWYDWRLAWPAENQSFPPTMNSRTVTTIPSARIWHPSILVVSGTNDVVAHSGGEMSPFTRAQQLPVTAQGLVLDQSYYIDHTYCEFESSHFPFESAECHIILFASDSAVNLVIPPLLSDGTIDYSKMCANTDAGCAAECFKGNGNGTQTAENCWVEIAGATNAKILGNSVWKTPNWELETYDTHTSYGVLPHITYKLIECYWGSGVNKITASFTLKRSSFQQALMWIGVPGGLSFAASLTIVTVCDRTERYGFGSAIVLALILMQTSLTDKLMPSEHLVPIISWYYTVLEALLFLSCIATSVVDMLAQKKRQRKWGHKGLANLLNMNRKDSSFMEANSTTCCWWLTATVVAAYAALFTASGMLWSR